MLTTFLHERYIGTGIGQGSQLALPDLIASAFIPKDEVLIVAKELGERQVAR